MIGSSKTKRENYPRKCLWTQEKETRVKFKPGLRANQPSNNWAQACKVLQNALTPLYSNQYVVIKKGLVFRIWFEKSLTLQRQLARNDAGHRTEKILLNPFLSDIQLNIYWNDYVITPRKASFPGKPAVTFFAKIVSVTHMWLVRFCLFSVTVEWHIKQHHSQYKICYDRTQHVSKALPTYTRKPN